jgi:hypothetical protein
VKLEWVVRQVERHIDQEAVHSRVEGGVGHVAGLRRAVDHHMVVAAGADNLAGRRVAVGEDILPVDRMGVLGAGHTVEEGHRMALVGAGSLVVGDS